MFKPGQSGNPKGRPKRDPTAKAVLIREAWGRLTSRKPYLVTEALERGLGSSRSLGFLELGARVMKEIGQQEGQQAQVTIVVNSPLNAQALRPVTLIPLPAPQSHPAIPEVIDADMTLLEIETDKP